MQSEEAHRTGPRKQPTRATLGEQERQPSQNNHPWLAAQAKQNKRLMQVGEAGLSRQVKHVSVSRATADELSGKRKKAMSNQLERKSSDPWTIKNRTMIRRVQQQSERPYSTKFCPHLITGKT